jgi:hypothetical protein
MRLILEKSEIIAVLSKHFDTELDPEKVSSERSPSKLKCAGYL